MKNHREWIVPTALASVMGGCWGLIQYFSYHWWAQNGLMSGTEAIKLYPFWGMTFETFRTLEHLLKLMLGLAAVSTSLWTWTRLLGSEFRQALTGGTTTGRARTLLGRSLAWGALNVALVACYKSASVEYWQGSISPLWQLAGLLSFAPAVWAASRQRELLTLVAPERERPLTGREFTLTAALVSPAVTAPFLCEAMQPHCTNSWIRSLGESATGPWPLAFESGLLLAGSGLALAATVSLLRGNRRAALGALAMVGALTVCAPTPGEAPEPTTSAATSCYTLVALDSTLNTQRVWIRTAANSNPVLARAEQALLENWNPGEALHTLSSSNDLWFQCSGGVFQRLDNCRPADLAPVLTEQLKLAESGYYLHDEKLDSVDNNKHVQTMRNRSQLNPTGALSGQLLLDGQPLAGTMLRLQRHSPEAYHEDMNLPSWTQATMQRESALGTNRHSWTFESVLGTMFEITDFQQLPGKTRALYKCTRIATAQ